VVTDDAPLKAHPGGRRAAGVVDLFARFLDGQTEALRRRGHVMPEERVLLLSNLDRYKRYNQMLQAAGLGQDQKDRIEAVSKAVEDLPAEEGGFPDRRTAGAGPLVLIGVLSLATFALGWLAAVRGRRLAALQRPEVRRLGTTEGWPRGDDV